MTRLERLVVAGVEPIEIWDLLTDDGDILWNRQHEPLVIAHAIESLNSGTAVSRSDGQVTTATGVRDVFLTGGQLMRSGPIDQVVDHLRSAGMTVVCSPEPIFAASAAAGRQWPDALVIDVGQTQVKVVNGDRRATRTRDLGVLPIRDDEGTDEIDGQRAAFVEMVAGAVDAVSDSGERSWTHVVLALPCSVDVDRRGDLTLGGSSYVGMEGDTQRLREIAALVPHASWSVLNDAELAAFAARESVANDAERQLVVTFGFGFGGCVWDPSAEVTS